MLPLSQKQRTHTCIKALVTKNQQVPAKLATGSTGTHTTEWQSTQGMLVSQSEKL